MLSNESLQLLNKEQKNQVRMQWDKHQHEDFVTDFPITPFGDSLNGFLIKKGVWNPTIVSARHHAAYMFYHNHLFYNKTAIDIGCGTGLIGMVMTKYGAQKTTLSDISKQAIENTLENVKTFTFEDKVNVVESDLFENLNIKADCISFMQPYFLGNPPTNDTIAASMLAPQELIERFLQDAKEHLNPNGVIVMPSFTLAGNSNSPAAVGEEFGYTVKTTFIAHSKSGLQKGTIGMHELTR